MLRQSLSRSAALVRQRGWKGEAQYIPPTIMSPYQGGPIYQWLRASIIKGRRDIYREPSRWLHWNWESTRHAFYGVPPLNLEPSKNSWRYFIETSYYGGLQDKVWEGIYFYWVTYPIVALMCLFVYKGLHFNDKFNFMAKWRTED
mmetsp:Transcript_8405/g.20887  ORF Transcript_8405/g.20887 Transcript_8405/m.20887 type:complete len:145 (-) Transcript_8405:155-589(-)